MSTLIGKTVYQYWSRNLRFGIVIEEKKEGGWKYCKVNWIDDEIYENSINYLITVRKMEYDEKYDWYRVDKIIVFDPKEVINRLNNLLNEID